MHGVERSLKVLNFSQHCYAWRREWRILFLTLYFTTSRIGVSLDIHELRREIPYIFEIFFYRTQFKLKGKEEETARERERDRRLPVAVHSVRHCHCLRLCLLYNFLVGGNSKFKILKINPFKFSNFHSNANLCVKKLFSYVFFYFSRRIHFLVVHSEDKENGRMKKEMHCVHN